MHNNGKNKTENDLHICRVCGYWDLTEPWGETGKDPTFHFCFCCGVEHGYQDCLPSSTIKFRDRWLASGAIWDNPSRKPADWNLEEQMKNITEEYR